MTEKEFKTIARKRFGSERALYGSRRICLEECRFEGEEDGESALKQCEDVVAKRCFHDLRYPYWHVRGLELDGCTMTENCRAALWYDSDVVMTDCDLKGIKAFRECDDVKIENSRISSPEFGWKCRGISLKDCRLTSGYVFLDSSDVTLENVDFDGKYSFQYAKGMIISNCRLDTKDAFWHTVDVTVKDSDFLADKPTLLGIAVYPQMKKVGFWASAGLGIYQCWYWTKFSLQSIWQSISHKKAPEVAGPIGIVNIIHQSVHRSLLDFIFLIGMLSLAVGMFNLFPIPILDGGYALVYLWEGLTGKLPSTKNIMRAANVGFYLLMLLVVYASYSDIKRIFFKPKTAVAATQTAGETAQQTQTDKPAAQEGN